MSEGKGTWDLYFGGRNVSTLRRSRSNVGLVMSASMRCEECTDIPTSPHGVGCGGAQAENPLRDPTEGPGWTTHLHSCPVKAEDPHSLLQPGTGPTGCVGAGLTHELLKLHTLHQPSLGFLRTRVWSESLCPSPALLGCRVSKAV